MMALGGKRVNGVEKEKRDLKPDFCPDCGEDITDAGRLTDVIARHSRKRQAAKKRMRMTILGGRMFAMIVRDEEGPERGPGRGVKDEDAG